MELTAHVADDLLPDQIEKWNLFFFHVADDLLPDQVEKWNLLFIMYGNRQSAPLSDWEMELTAHVADDLLPDQVEKCNLLLM